MNNADSLQAMVGKVFSPGNKSEQSCHQPDPDLIIFVYLNTETTLLLVFRLNRSNVPDLLSNRFKSRL
jgi:hypothetical protein